MTKGEVVKWLESLKKEIGKAENCTLWHYAESIDMAIEALSNADQRTQHVESVDLISRQDAIKNAHFPVIDDASYEVVRVDDILTLPSAKSTGDLISIQMAIEHWGRSSGNLTNDQIAELQREIESLPSADRPTTDCTEFMEWLKAEVLDENNWELNAVAYGEIICRKLKKLGWIDVEDGCYVDTRPTGKWVEVEDYNGDIHYQCDQCGEEFILIDGTPEDNNYWHCPNCGSYNGGGEAVAKGADNESTL